MGDFHAAVAATQASRVDDGLEPLPVAAEAMQFETITTPGSEPSLMPRGYWREKDNVIAGLARAIAHLAPGESLGQRSIKRIAKVNRAHQLPGGYAGPIPSWDPIKECLRQDKYAGENLQQWLTEAETMAADGAIPPWLPEDAQKAPPAWLKLKRKPRDPAADEAVDDVT